MKVYIDEAVDIRVVHHENMTEEQMAIIEENSEFLAGTFEPGEIYEQDVMDPQTGQMVRQEIQTYNVTARYVKPDNTIRIEAVPPEEVLVDNDLRTVDLDESGFVCHHREVSRSELVSMGYDRDLVWDLPVARELKHSGERESRSEHHEEDPNYEPFGRIALVNWRFCFRCVKAAGR